MCYAQCEQIVNMEVLRSGAKHWLMTTKSVNDTSITEPVLTLASLICNTESSAVSCIELASSSLSALTGWPTWMYVDAVLPRKALTVRGWPRIFRRNAVRHFESMFSLILCQSRSEIPNRWIRWPYNVNTRHVHINNRKLLSQSWQFITNVNDSSNNNNSDRMAIHHYNFYMYIEKINQTSQHYLNYSVTSISYRQHQRYEQ